MIINSPEWGPAVLLSRGLTARWARKQDSRVFLSKFGTTNTRVLHIRDTTRDCVHLLDPETERSMDVGHTKVKKLYVDVVRQEVKRSAK